MTEFQFLIEDLRWWAPEGVEILQWPDHVPIYADDAPTDHAAFLSGHTYVYTLPQDLEEILKNGGGEVLPHFEGLSDAPDSDHVPKQRLTHLFFRELSTET